MSVQPVPTVTASIAEVFRQAVSESQPLFMPVSVYADDRGWSLMNQFTGVLAPEGQVNFSMQYPGVVKAWHRHRLQTDFWLCLVGNLKVGVHREDGTSWSLVVGEKRPGVVVIPPTLWHGAATVGPTSAGLLYFVTQAYNPAAPDEERRAPESVEGFPWTVEHR